MTQAIADPFSGKKKVKIREMKETQAPKFRVWPLGKNLWGNDGVIAAFFNIVMMCDLSACYIR